MGPFSGKGEGQRDNLIHLRRVGSESDLIDRSFRFDIIESSSSLLGVTRPRLARRVKRSGASALMRPI